MKERCVLKYAIGRPINGITLNGNEYVLDENGEMTLFDSMEEAKSFLYRHGLSEEEINDLIFEEIEQNQ